MYPNGLGRGIGKPVNCVELYNLLCWFIGLVNVLAVCSTPSEIILYLLLSCERNSPMGLFLSFLTGYVLTIVTLGKSVSIFLNLSEVNGKSPAGSLSISISFGVGGGTKIDGSSGALYTGTGEVGGGGAGGGGGGLMLVLGLEERRERA